MLIPGIFGDNLFDDFFDFDYPIKKVHKKQEPADNRMKTDIKEYAKGYELDIDLPGYQKENIQAELKDGYLTIRAKYSDHQEETAQKTGRFIRRERCTGSCSRSFYVGEEITREDIKAKYENGVLRLSVPKKEPKKPEAEAKKFITIEG